MGMNKNKIEIKVYNYDTRFVFDQLSYCCFITAPTKQKEQKVTEKTTCKHAIMQKITFNDTYNVISQFLPQRKTLDTNPKVK